MLADAQWTKLEPLIEACRPKGKTPPQDQRRTISAIVWRHQTGAKWRAIPADLGRWSRAAQTVIRWARLGVWERLSTERSSAAPTWSAFSRATRPSSGSWARSCSNRMTNGQSRVAT